MREAEGDTHDFIDNALVGVEVKREAGVAAEVVRSMKSRRMADGRTYYFSMSTRDALLVVFVRTRPYTSYAVQPEMQHFCRIWVRTMLDNEEELESGLDG